MLLTVDEAAEVLRVSRQRVYAMARAGLIPAVHMGRQVRFSETAIRTWICEGGRTLQSEVRGGRLERQRP